MCETNNKAYNLYKNNCERYFQPELLKSEIYQHLKATGIYKQPLKTSIFSLIPCLTKALSLLKINISTTATSRIFWKLFLLNFDNFQFL